MQYSRNWIERAGHGSVAYTVWQCMSHVFTSNHGQTFNAMAARYGVLMVVHRAAASALPSRSKGEDAVVVVYPTGSGGYVRRVKRGWPLTSSSVASTVMRSSAHWWYTDTGRGASPTQWCGTRLGGRKEKMESPSQKTFVRLRLRVACHSSYHIPARRTDLGLAVTYPHPGAKKMHL